MIRTNTFIDDWLEEAFERGFQQGIQQGIKEYQQQFLLGQLITRRELILKLLVLRFDPPVSYYQQTQQLLGDIDDLTTLRTIFATAVRSETLADLQAALSE